MPKTSAALLLYRLRGTSEVEVLIAHPGGPYWASKDEGAWSVPKGEYAPEEDPLAAARREFKEETGSDPPTGPYVELGEIRQRAGKVVVAWAAEGDLDAGQAVSNTFEMEWPPRSGKRATFPEVDRLAWLPLHAARPLLVEGQRPLLDRLVGVLDELRARAPAPAPDGGPERSA
jgi:predicted NUDIX family NTP pyrophosphohydrolase